MECYYIAGQCDRPSGRTVIIEEAHFDHPRILDISRRAFDAELRREMVEHNYRVAQRYFSYEVLEKELHLVIERPRNVYRLLGRTRRADRTDI